MSFVLFAGVSLDYCDQLKLQWTLVLDRGLVDICGLDGVELEEIRRLIVSSSWTLSDIAQPFESVRMLLHNRDRTQENKNRNR